MITEINPDAPGALYPLRQTSGAGLCRGLFAPHEVDALRRFASFAYAAGEAMVANLAAHEVPTAVSDGQIVWGYVSWPRLTAALSCAGRELTEQPDAMVDRTRALAEAVYGSPVRFLDNFAIARRHRASPRPTERTKVPWHRDSTFIGPSGAHDTINFWVPLIDVGTCAPSLELILGSHLVMERIPEERPGYTQIEDAWIEQHLST
jgi:Phytanoyl-CoA dioxygenase (PhyH)